LCPSYSEIVEGLLAECFRYWTTHV
jgi:hypothetical protein